MGVQTSRPDFDHYLKEQKVDYIFLDNLERFCNWAHSKYFVVVSKEEFYDWCRDKVIPALPSYDPKKATFKTFIHTLVRWEATRVNSKYERISNRDDDFSRITETKIEENLVRYGDQIDNFEALAKSKGLEFDRDKFIMDLTGECCLPSTKVFLWLSYKGEV